jgi:hypothetical protein
MAISRGKDRASTHHARTGLQKVAALVLAFFALSSPAVQKAALAQAGYRAPQAARRLQEQIRRNKGFGAARHSGRPKTVYTDEAMEEACRYLTEDDEQRYTSRTLMPKVLKPGPHSKKKFMKALRAYVRRKGHTLSTSTKAMTYLSDSDKKARLAYCRELKALLAAGKISLSQIVFEDETGLQWPPHPKSEWKEKNAQLLHAAAP